MEESEGREAAMKSTNLSRITKSSDRRGAGRVRRGAFNAI